VKLTTADLDEIEPVASEVKIQGDRYPEAMMKLSGLQRRRRSLRVECISNSDRKNIS
jgi:hypothetical protein